MFRELLFFQWRLDCFCDKTLDLNCGDYKKNVNLIVIWMSSPSFQSCIYLLIYFHFHILVVSLVTILAFVLRQKPHFLQSKQQIRLHPTRLIVWKQLQQEAHTTHLQACDVRRSSRRPVRWPAGVISPQLRVLTLISAVICIIILKCIMSIFFPLTRSLSRYLPHKHVQIPQTELI